MICLPESSPDPEKIPKRISDSGLVLQPESDRHGPEAQGGKIDDWSPDHLPFQGGLRGQKELARLVGQ